MEQYINAEVEQLSEIIGRYRNCVATRNWDIAKAVLEEWGQATKTALEAAYRRGYEDRTEEVLG